MSPPPNFFPRWDKLCFVPPFFNYNSKVFQWPPSTFYMIRERLGQNARYTNFVSLGSKFTNTPPFPRLSTTEMRSQWGPIKSFCPGAQRGLSPPLPRQCVTLTAPAECANKSLPLLEYMTESATVHLPINDHEFK